MIVESLPPGTDALVTPISVCLEDLNVYTGNLNASTVQLRTALSIALRSMERYLRAEHTIVYELRGRNEISLHELNIEDDAPIRIEFLSKNEWRPPARWDVSGGKLHVPFNDGLIRIIAMTRPPLVNSQNWSTAEHIDYYGNEIWLIGRINELRRVGWIRVQEKIFFYQGLTYENTPDLSFPALNQVISENSSIDPEIFHPVYDIPMTLNVYTRLHNARQWPYRHNFSALDIGVQVEPCISYRFGEAYHGLILAAAANLYRLKLNACTQPEDKQLFAQLLRNAQEELQLLLPRISVYETATLKRRPVLL